VDEGLLVGLSLVLRLNFVFQNGVIVFLSEKRSMVGKFPLFSRVFTVNLWVGSSDSFVNWDDVHVPDPDEHVAPLAVPFDKGTDQLMVLDEFVYVNYSIVVFAFSGSIVIDTKHSQKLALDRTLTSEPTQHKGMSASVIRALNFVQLKGSVSIFIYFIECFFD
jgi:hypothetical protein